MISFAKKILINGRTAAGQPPAGEADVRKYSLTSAHESPSPISATSFALNPEHQYSTTYRYSWSGRTNWNSQEDTILNTDGITLNPDLVDSVIDTTETLISPGESNSDISERSNHIEVMCRQPSRATVDISEDKYLGVNSSITQSNENLTGVVTTVSISPSEAERQSLHQENESRFQVKNNDTEQQVLSDEKISESQMQIETWRGNSLCSLTDDVLDLDTAVSGITAVSTSSLNILEASTRFQQARRKQRWRELKPRRKTLEIFYFGDKSRDAVASETSWPQCKSLMPSPTNLEPNCVDLRPRRSAWRSRVRRHTMDGSDGGLGVETSPEDQILGDSPSFWNVLWPSVCSSSDEVVSDVSKVDRRGKAVQSGEGAKKASGLRKGRLCASVICVSDMMQCQVIADLDLLEEDTEFEPCAVPFENTAVLWPAAVDKPSCFESSGCFRSWINNLETSGFVGSECLLMSPVTLSQGLHERTQLLFLFPSHLLFAEQKSHSTLKLDQKVAAGDVWLSTRKEDLAAVLDMDTTLDGSRSVVLGWPPTNTVVTFCTSEEKAVWVAKIEELIEAANAKDKDSNQQLVIKILHKERGHTRMRELTTAKSENLSQVLQRFLLEFHPGVSSSKDFQLFVRTSKDQPMQPLLGHESPFLIETWFRNFSARREGSHCYCFVLRERKRTKLASPDAAGWRRTSRAPLRALFKRSQFQTAKSLPLFGSSLSEICVENSIPVRIQAMLRYLYEHGPSTDGVFRKPGGHKEVNDFKIHLNMADEVSFENVSVHVVASVVKEWLRNLPDCLLSSELYHQWIDVSKISEVALVHEGLRRLSSSLPASHLLILRHLMCVLHRIQLHSKQNRMTPFNLAVCIGPNVLHPPPSANIDLQLTSIEIANAVIRMLIEAIEPVLGSDCVELYQDIADPRLIHEFEIDGSYEVCHQAISAGHSFAQNSTELLMVRSLESLDSLHYNPPVAELDQLLESMSPDSGLAASNPQLYEEDPLISETQSKGRYLKRIHRCHELHWKSETSDVSENQTLFDSDTGSLSSQASERSASVQGPLQMHGGKNAQECLQQFQLSKPNAETLTRSSENQFSCSDNPSDSALEATSESTKTASVLKVERNEMRSLCHKADVFSTTHDESEKFEKGEKNDQDSNAATKISERNTGKVGFSANDEASRKPPEAPLKKPAASKFRLTSVEIISSQVISTGGDVLLQTVGTTEARPTKQGKMSSSVVRNWVKKIEEGQSGNITQTKQNPVTSSKSPKAAVEFEIGNPGGQVIRGRTSDAIVHKSGRDKLEDLPKVMSKVEQSLSTLRTRGELVEPCGATLEICEQHPITLNLSGVVEHSQNKMLVVPQKTCAKEMVPLVFKGAVSGKTDSPDSGKCSQQTESIESITVSKQIGHPVSRKANHQTESRKFDKQTDSSELRKVVKQFDSPESGKVSKQFHSPDSKNVDWHMNHKSEKSQVGHSGQQEKHPDPLQHLTDPYVRSIKISMDENTTIHQSKDQQKDNRSRFGCGKVGLNNRLLETERRDKDYRLEDQPCDVQLKVQPTERRLKDQPRDSRSRDGMLKVQPRDSDDMWRLEHTVQEETEWRNRSLEERGLKDHPTISRLKDQSRDNSPKDQPRKSRAFADNWRPEHVTSARVITAYPRNITSKGCQATLATPTGHFPHYLTQNREPQQNGQPVCSLNRTGAQRRVTVIQLCDDNSVITQKTVKTT